MLGLSFYFKVDWGSYIVSIGKTATKKIGALVQFMKWKVQALELLFISLNLPYDPIWVVAPNWYLDMFDKLEKRLCMTVCPSLLPLLNPFLIIKM